MNLKKALEPKNVEELKPNFFVQEKAGIYRQVNPLIWKGKWRLKGQIGLRHILMITLILFLFFTGAKYVRFYEAIVSDPKTFCMNIPIIDVENYEVRDENTNSISTNFEEANKRTLPG